MLNERKKKILKAIVEDYIETAEPVGSKAIAQRTDLGVSSATIRNEMADLENQGYLEQPHTSAGRIPSPKGYRFYVNELMQEHRLSLEETAQINQALHLKMQELDRVVEQAGRIVSQLTQYPAYALSAGKQQATIRRFNLMSAEPQSFILVVMTDSNQIRNKLVRLPLSLSDEQLQMVTAVLNDNFTGLSLAQLTPQIMSAAEQAAGAAMGLVSLALNFAVDVLTELENHPVYTAGASHIFEHPEYRSVDKAQELMTFLSDGQELSQLPMTDEGNSMKIFIGPENVSSALKDSSVIVASYDIGDNMRGLIGVVGPTRMDYAKVAARLSYLADGFGRLFQSGTLPPPPEDPET